jgi:hypothetical protein
MLPPIPQGLIPVTAQQDVPRPRPEIQPVAPVAPMAEETALSLQQRQARDAEELLREQHRRQQRRAYNPEELAEGEGVADDAELDDMPRQGLWVDIEV